MLKLTEKEQICLDALEEICKKYEMENDYCVNTYTEQRVCLCKREYNWEVFTVERGIEFDKTKHKDCIDACLKVLKQCSYSIDEFKDASKEFKDIIEMYKQTKIIVKK